MHVRGNFGKRMLSIIK